MKILVVEDDPATQKLYQVLLPEYGYEVYIVGTKQDAMNALDTIPLDRVLTDGTFPDHGHQDYGKWGLDVARKARKSGIHAVLFTGDYDLVEQAESTGIAAKLKGMVRLEELLDALEVAS